MEKVTARDKIDNPNNYRCCIKSIVYNISCLICSKDKKEIHRNFVHQFKL